MTTQIEFEAHVQILTKKVEEKEKVETVERDCQKKVETLKLENVEREMKNDKRMEDMKAKNECEEEEDEERKKKSRMVAKLQELVAQNRLLAERVKEMEDKPDAIEREVNKKIEELIEENAKRIEEIRKESSERMEKTIAENEERAERVRVENEEKKERMRREIEEKQSRLIVKKVCHLIENSGSEK